MRKMCLVFFRTVSVSLVWLSVCTADSRSLAEEMPRVVVGPDRREFVLRETGKPFVPWGFNYDHDEQGRLIEDYWDRQWPKVEEDFGEMKKLGANVVRVHLQFGKFMSGPRQAETSSLKQLARLVKLAERLGLYLDLTGLGCYHKQDVPEWYDRLSETDRWQAQAAFWEAIARQCADSPAIFCYDLMNEPVVPGGRRKPGEWLGPPFAGKHFVQFVTLDQGERTRPEIARAWIRELSAAVRKHDRRHLITVGLVSWSLDRPGLTSGFVPEKIVGELDFLSVHVYPETAQPGEAIKTLAGFSVGKPVVIEETFPLKCTVGQLDRFLDDSRQHAAGWMGFYWGKTPEECRRSNQIRDVLMLGWLELFQKKGSVLLSQ